MVESLQRVVVLGLGPIGRAVAQEITQDSGMTLVGAVDPAYAGQRVAEVLGAKSAPRGTAGLEVRVAESVNALGSLPFDVAVHMAGSRFPKVAAQLAELVRQRVHIVSTCEELIAAAVRWPKEAEELDAAAKEVGVAVLAAGVNPGFVMDLLPSAMTNVCVSVRSIRVTRHVDTSKRRRALQEKTGAGLTRAEFTRKAREGAVGHVGLRDSLLFFLDHVNVGGEAGAETLRPIIASKAVGKGAARVAKGRVAGVHQRVVARDPKTKKTVAVYELKMAIGLAKPFDEIVIDGDPPVRVKIEGGIQGDRATVGMVMSSIRASADARPGLAR